MEIKALEDYINDILTKSTFDAPVWNIEYLRWLKNRKPGAGETRTGETRTGETRTGETKTEETGSRETKTEVTRAGWNYVDGCMISALMAGRPLYGYALLHGI